MKEKDIPIKGKRMVLVIITFLFLGILLTTGKAAAAVNTIPNSGIIVSDSKMFKMCATNYTAEWHGVSGKVLPGKYSTYKALCVPIKTKTAAFSYTDFLDITFSNAGEINGRAVNVKVHFNSMTVSKRGGDTAGERADNYMSVCYMTGSFLWLKGNHEDGAGYKAATTIDITTTVYYADTGETVNMPFFQAVQDLDAGASYYTEGWEAVSGYTGNYYIYKECNLSISGNKFMSVKINTSGDDSVTKTGLYATTTGGVMRSKFYEGNCATAFKLTSQYRNGMLSPPTLKIDNTHPYKVGDEVVIDVNQKIGTLYAEVYDAYTEFIIRDDIPSGLAYKSAKVIDSSGKDVTSQGTLKYDKAAKTVTFSFSSAFLKNMSNYDGDTYTLKITTTAEPIEGTIKNIKDTGESVISTVNAITNEQAITVVAPELSIQKSNAGNKYYTGETASYNITFGQIIEGAEAEDVVITDTLPAGLKLVSESVKVTGLTKSQYELETSSNQIKLSLKDDIPHGEYAITYDAKIIAEDIDQVLTNTANITSTNADKRTSDSELTVLEIPKFMASYTFESADKDLPLPQSVIDLLPEDKTEYIKGNTVKAENPKKTTVDVGTGKWEFLGYKDNSYVIDAANVIFSGVWKYTEYPAPLTLDKRAETGIYYTEDKIEYTIDFSQDLAGIDAENVVLTDTLPKGLILDEESICITGLESNQYKVTADSKGFTVKIPSLNYGKYKIRYIAIADIGRVETDLTNTANINADNAKEAKQTVETVKINGQVIAEYKFISEDKDIELPDEVMKLLPEDKAWYKDGDTINAIEPGKKTVITDAGRWDFTGYDKTSVISTGEDVLFTGIWKLTAPELNISKTHEDKTYYRGDTVYYEIAFSQDTDKAYALDVTFADKLPEGERLIENSIEIKELDRRDYDVKITDEGFGIIIKKLSSGKYTLSYECEIDTEDKEQELINIVGIKADNVKDTLKAEDTVKVSEIPKYVRYTFKTDSGNPVPKKIAELLPADDKAYYDGDEVTPKGLSKTKLKVIGGTWEFIGWDKEAAAFEGSDILFTGMWKFIADVPITADSDFPYIALAIMLISGTCLTAYKKAKE